MSAPSNDSNGVKLPRGLKNPGSLCFLNAAVQFLFQVPALTRRAMAYDEGGCAITSAYAQLIRDLLDREADGPADPSHLWRAFKARFTHFQEHETHDATEVIVFLLDVFESSLGVQFIQDLFYGETETTVTAVGSEGLDHDRTFEVLSQTKDTIILVNLPSFLPGDKLEDILYEFSVPVEMKDFVDDDGRRREHAYTSTVFKKYPHACMFVFGNANMHFPVDLPAQWNGRTLVAMILHVDDAAGAMQHYVVACCIHGKWFFKDDGCVIELDYTPDMPRCYAALYDSRRSCDVPSEEVTLAPLSLL